MKNAISPAIKPIGRLTGHRRVLILTAALAMAVAGYALWKYVANTPQPWLARIRVQHFLAKRTFTGNFSAEFTFPSKAEMAKAPLPSSALSLKRTQETKDFEARGKEHLSLKTSALALERQVAAREAELKAAMAQLETLSRQLADSDAADSVALQSKATRLRDRVAELQKRAAGARSELQAKGEALAPVASDLRSFQARWLAEAEADGSASAARVARRASQFTADLTAKFPQAAGYDKMYQLIGQELWVAKRLLTSANPGHQRVGLTLALDASHHALADAQNGWVAARICEGYVWPHLHLASDANPDSPFNQDNLLGECADIFRQNLEVQNVLRICQKIIARPGGTQRPDWARSQIALACEEAGDLRQALQWWRQIQNTNDYRWVSRRLPALEQQLARK